MDWSMPGFPVLHHLLEFAQIHDHWVSDVLLSNHLVLCSHLLLLSSVLPSIQGFFQWVSLSHQATGVLALQLSFSPSNEYSGLISFRIDWFDLLAVQGTLKSLLQHHSLKASILRCSAFFIVQLRHLYMTTGQTIALTIRTFVSKLMSLLYNMLSRFVIVFLPRSKYLLISWLQSLSTLILEPKKIKSVNVSTFLFAMKWWDWMP